MFNFEHIVKMLKSLDTRKRQVCDTSQFRFYILGYAQGAYQGTHPPKHHITNQHWSKLHFKHLVQNLIFQHMLLHNNTQMLISAMKPQICINIIKT